MTKITNVSFMSFEFDFGYSEETEEDQQNLGRIDAEVFVEIDNSGEKNVITHKVRLDEASYSDFLTEQEINNLDFGNSFSDAIQQIRQLVAMKVASDLGLELVDVGYVAKKTLRDDVEDLQISQADQDEAIMLLMLGGS